VIDVAPVEMIGAREVIQLVSVIAVTVADSEMEGQLEQGQGDQQHERGPGDAGPSLRLGHHVAEVLGIGLQNKLSVLWLGGGLAVGLLLTPERRLLSTRGPWLAALISLVLAAP
jgi:hypothetical protein